MKVSSNLSAAQDAVAGFTKVEVAPEVQPATLGSSNVSSMKDGTLVANSLMDCIAELASAVKRQASKITALATEVGARDDRDASAWGEAR